MTDSSLWLHGSTNTYDMTANSRDLMIVLTHMTAICHVMCVSTIIKSRELAVMSQSCVLVLSYLIVLTHMTYNSPGFMVVLTHMT
jgi:hypothetical protein